MEEKKLSYNKQQLKERPTIRQIAERFLNDNLRSQLESFLYYIEENEMPLSLARCNTYQSNFKGKTVFRIEIANGQACRKDVYAIRVYTADDPDFYRSEENRVIIQNKLNHYLLPLENDMADYFINHLPRCRGCGKCKPGKTLEILGQTRSAVCACDMYAMRVNNPGEDDYSMIKKFISARKQHILNKGADKK